MFNKTGVTMRKAIDELNKLLERLESELKVVIINNSIVKLRAEIVSKRAELYRLKSKAQSEFSLSVLVFERLMGKERNNGSWTTNNRLEVSATIGRFGLVLNYHDETIQYSLNDFMDMKLFFNSVSTLDERIKDPEEFKALMGVSPLEIMNFLKKIQS